MSTPPTEYPTAIIPTHINANINTHEADTYGLNFINMDIDTEGLEIHLPSATNGSSSSGTDLLQSQEDHLHHPPDSNYTDILANQIAAFNTHFPPPSLSTLPPMNFGQFFDIGQTPF